MSASSGSDTAGPAAAAHLDAQLRTAWLLRNHVLPCVDDSDKGPLALALPAALAAPCCCAAHAIRNDNCDLRLPSLCSEYLLRELVGACVPQRLCPATCWIDIVRTYMEESFDRSVLCIGKQYPELLMPLPVVDGTLPKKSFIAITTSL
eukprot:m51a1_g8585 hypothetical protein (149) ;mRNA; f:44892-48595